MTAPNAPDYSLTVYVAAPGTPHVRDGVTTYSTPGHLYWAISDGNTVNGYGFGPRTPGDIHGPGSVSIRDHREYQNPMYERQMAISREQYEALKEFGRRTIDGDDPRFNSSSITDSYGLGNNCVDYTWKALEVAGIHQQRPYANDDRVSVREVMLGREAYLRYEGALRPVDNIRDLQRLQDPIQGHPLNQTIEREPPRLEGVDLIRRLLSENDPRHPDRRSAGACGRCAARANTRRGECQPHGKPHVSFEARRHRARASSLQPSGQGTRHCGRTERFPV
jgi:hypothetical protein